MRYLARSILIALSLTIAPGGPAANPVLVTVNPGITFATYNYNIVLPAPIYQSIANSPSWPLEKAPYLQQLVNQLGINTLDVGEYPGDMENIQDWFTP